MRYPINCESKSEKGDKQAAKGIVELSGNNPPSYPDKFAFISHTASDMPFIEKHIAPILRSRYMDYAVLNYMQFTKEYAQYILRLLSNSGWFLVILSAAASRSNGSNSKLIGQSATKIRNALFPS
jgi:hypothetical protein